MSDLINEVRAKHRAKAEQRVGERTDPHKKVDGSDWEPLEPLKAEVQTGCRPVSRQKYKRGGKVEGEHAVKHAGRKPRKTGGKAIVDEFVNRDVKAANAERAGYRGDDGGYKRGGRTQHRMDGGYNAGDMVPTSRMAFQPGTSRMAKSAGLKRGGEAKHPDEAEDKALIRKEVKSDCLKRKHGGRADAHWIKEAIHHPGALHKELHVPQGEKIPAKKLAKAEHSKNKLVAKRAHLAETLREMHPHECSGGRVARKDGGATYRSGGDSLPEGNGNGPHRASGGRAKSKDKGKMNVNIIIGTKEPQGQGPMAGPMPMPPRPAPVPVGGPPMAGPVPPMGGPGPMPPQMARKAGGRTYRSVRDLDAGAGSGEGRLEKAEIQGRKR